MTFKELKNQIKEQQKELARKIRRGKFLRKPDNRRTSDITKEDKSLYYYKGYGGGSWYDVWKVKELSREYRHVHIAYCQFFNGTDYALIENPRDEYDHRPNMSTVDAYMNTWKEMIDEDVRRNAA